MDRFDWIEMPEVLRIAAELERVHVLLSDVDGDPAKCSDVIFARAMTRSLMNDPTSVERVRRIAAEFSMLLDS